MAVGRNCWRIFRGANGYLGLELWGKDKALAGTVLPQFFTRAGEEIEIPTAFVSVAKALTAAVNSIGCTSSCYLTAPTATAVEPAGGSGDRAQGLTQEMAATSV